MKITFPVISLLFIFLLVSCQSDNDERNDHKTIVLDEKSAQLVQADNAFGLDIFQKIRENSSKDNIMVSPLSISIALAMAYNGADGETRDEMEQTLRLNGLTPGEINASYKMLIRALQSLDENVTFEIANSIFYANGFPVKQGFLDINHTNYDAEVKNLDFGDPSTLDIINNWVADKTHDKITKIINDLSPDARMVLINAIYFLGTWSAEFEEKGTKMRDFTKVDGNVIEVAMMRKEDKLEYASNDLFSAVKLPYGSGQYSMTVMLPSEGVTSQELIAEINAQKWDQWSHNFEIQDHVVVTMPRFKFDFDTKLVDVLKQMGMIKAFSTKVADFSGISDQYLFISDVIHKTFIDVNETGTEAAAVTAIVFETTSAGPGPEKIYFHVDRPFVFAITEKDTGAILFIGEVQNPVYED